MVQPFEEKSHEKNHVFQRVLNDMGNVNEKKQSRL